MNIIDNLGFGQHLRQNAFDNTLPVYIAYIIVRLDKAFVVRIIQIIRHWPNISLRTSQAYAAIYLSWLKTNGRLKISAENCHLSSTVRCPNWLNSRRSRGTYNVQPVCFLSSLLLFVFTKCNQDRIDWYDIHRPVYVRVHTYVGFLTSEIENVAPLGLPRPPLHTFHTIVLENKIPRFVGA